MEWTPEMIDRMLALAAEGVTRSQIARALGVSKNAVCGKMHREKLKRGHAPTPRKFVPKPIAKESKPVLVIVPAAPSNLASIIDVTGCKWPVKDDPAMIGGIACCNEPTDEGKPYCPHHMQASVAHYSRTLIKSTLRNVFHVLNRRVA